LSCVSVFVFGLGYLLLFNIMSFAVVEHCTLYLIPFLWKTL